MKPQAPLATTLLALACASAGATTAPPQPASWACELRGQWSETSPRNTGKFQWSMVWTSTPSGAEVTVRSREPAGNSALQGLCTPTRCTLEQTYTSGDMQGNRFQWQGEFTRSTPNAPSHTLTLSGTWGDETTPQAGPWKAQGRCTPRR